MVKAVCVPNPVVDSTGINERHVYLSRSQIQKELLWGLREESNQVSEVAWVGERTPATSDRTGPLFVRKTAVGKKTQVR